VQVHQPTSHVTVDEETTSPPSMKSPEPRRRRRARRAWAYTIAALVLLATGFGFGRALDDDASAAPVPTQQEQNADSVPIANAAVESADEPVAGVAASLLPSTVQIETESGLGSGFVYDDQGHILTAAHVVDGYDSVQIRRSDGSLEQGSVVGADPGTDVAVIKIDRTDLEPAPLALDVPLQVGQMTVAVGSPFGFEGTVTSGVVSSTAQPLLGSRGTVLNMIQTDAAINPGNSGGPLANREGQVIGINDSIYSRSGGNEGVGFAIPIDTAKQVADKLVAGEPVERALLGVTGTDPTMGDPGALITGISRNGAAAGAGLEIGDLVIEADGQAVAGMADLAAIIGSHQPGDRLVLTVKRGDGQVQIEAILGAAG